MIGVFVNMALGALEWASAVALYRQFIYEETVQMGVMGGFALMNSGLGVNSIGIAKAMDEEGIGPGRADLEEFGYLIPFARTSLEWFYTCAEYMVTVMF